ncbi:acyl-CoA dehydrogenase NM domain-like protein [Exidia glandulosa HHB12029]|uniref:Acyl-CoA dehydrogenase NM domain-like protein n=1 Tax=Exidia glandulosa HHB12029 TaxID=1314781 RepID=A0A165DYK6_EXIGL|nr:acyl-CoA dehydrogenase NM domain-like protein [Exidia glandulosa HHB12029]
MASTKTFTREEVAKHNKPGDLWIVVDTRVYDISKFAALHPGGQYVLTTPNVAGKDATDVFYSLHRKEVLDKPMYKRLVIGAIANEQPTIQVNESSDALSKVPYGEPMGLTPGYHTPYYTENHRAFQRAARKFMMEEVYSEAMAREEDGKRISQSVVDKMAEVGWLHMRLGPGKHLKGVTLLGGVVKPEDFDYFHELIYHQEGVRIGARGFNDGQLSGMAIGLPPVLNFARPEVKERVAAECFSGKKYISLAITEAFAGSDVAGLQTTAVKSDDGKFWIINGTKKWITNGTFSDYFTTACRTKKGLTVILVPRVDGVETRPIKTAYSATAGTAYITFDNVKVPVEYTLGEEDKGLKVVLSNFNHERWMLAAHSAALHRTIVEECLKWANQRYVFGKPLHDQAVIRAKLAGMIARMEAGQAWLEQITHQMTKNYNEQSDKLAGSIGLLKMFVTRSARETAEEAQLVFGGRGLTKTGLGRLIEMYHRTSGFDAILGGVEDVLGDLGVRQALKKMPKSARL